MEYTVEHSEDCGCTFSWRIDGDTITEDCDSSECYESNTLYANGDRIGEYVRYDGWTSDSEIDDVPDNILDKCRLSEMTERGDTGNNDTHEANRREALIDWLADLVDAGYRLMRDNERNFGNEYTCILVSPGTDADEIGDDWDELDAEKWADEYLYNGDATTEAYNSATVI